MASDDPYLVLGVSPHASDDEIRAAYREKVKTSHPDRRPEDPEAAADFRRIQAAYERLRRRDSSVGGRPPSSSKSTPPKAREDTAAFQDRFERVFREKREEARYGRSPYTSGSERGTLRVPFEVAILGGDHKLEVEFNRQPVKTLRVTLPPGAINGDRFRIEGKIVRVHVVPHPHLWRDGDDVFLDVPVSVAELALGAKLRVPTVTGFVEIEIPPSSRSGQRLRLKQKGVKGKGDQFCILNAETPDASGSGVKEALERLHRADDRSPRPWDDGPATPNDT